ncbi:L-lactate dehydrogenase (cytochrome) [Tistlia consotensis]|uniref:L-lactate dehydrogenase (Cytochrome) n=1 Tax=Tistlia consotensis USBA 355 TaxID=560819 RepID=A0A1Y6C672_9PROT|nr:alpha-hydroxy acid oxidase [Tistlia consotensis]SMF38924.1 L-lactate dehydrogenase (cytochrome) [Tistlia consotensis USBA 355]SNR36696.1 L-lactate dehydrogenase (cytochrome) [Tistlia consotensis]
MPGPGRIVTSVEDLREIARRHVPRMFYDYVDTGSWTGATYRRNEADLAGIQFRQRVAVDISQRSTESRMLGEAVTMPVALAPTGLCGMQHADGEILSARAAERFGVPFTLSTVSICSIEDVAAATSRPFWFQLYMLRDRDFMERLIGRARAAGCSALVLTLDLQIQGQRHKDLKNGITVPPRLTLPNLLDLMTKPRWCLGMLATRRRSFGNIIGHVANVGDLTSLSHWVAAQFDPTLCWDDIAWIKERWPGKLVVKGIMDAEDARRAVERGADAVIVSNHGGRQLDSAPSTIAVLPEIVEAVGHRTEVHLDSGIRSGQDAFRALALGARAVHIGRAYQYGLGAFGEAGVTRCLELIRKELDHTMAFCGVTRVEDIGPAQLYRPRAGERREDMTVGEDQCSRDLDLGKVPA